MFSNLSKGSVLYGLDNKKDTHFTAVVDMVTLPYSKNQHPTFGQLPEMVVDIVANVNGDRKEFKQVPCNNAIADFGPDALVLADSKDSLSNYVRSLRQTSKNIVDSYPVHKERIPKYDKILKLGHHFLNSISQLTIIVVGTIIKCGPQFPLFIAKYANNAIVWIVLPKPISSAKIPLILFSFNATSQFRPIN